MKLWANKDAEVPASIREAAEGALEERIALEERDRHSGNPAAKEPTISTKLIFKKVASRVSGQKKIINMLATKTKAKVVYTVGRKTDGLRLSQNVDGAGGSTLDFVERQT